MNALQLREDPPGPAGGKERVVRGGAWHDRGENCRSARRDHRPPELRYDDVGFRVVRVAR